MNFKSLTALVLFAAMALGTGCSKKSVPITSFPASTTTTTVGTSQNYVPYTQDTTANPSYYGNGAYVSNDTSGFDNSSAVSGTTPTGTTGTTGTTSSSTSGLGDLDLDAGGLPNLQPYSPPGGTSASANFTLAGNYKVDQDSYLPGGLLDKYLPSRNQWQASGVLAVGTDLIVTAVDKSGLMKKGTVIMMSGEDGTNWKNIGSQWLGLKYPMDTTVKGIAADSSGNLYANADSNFIYTLLQPKLGVAKIASGLSSAFDIASVNSSIIVSTSTGLKKFESSALTSGSDFASAVKPTGGICTDSLGNLYVVAGSVIKKITPAGQVSDAVTSVSGGIDVAVTDDKRIFVLTSSGINTYDEKGKSVNTFGTGDVASPQSIATNGMDLFVADAGSTYKDSQIVKYSRMTL